MVVSKPGEEQLLKMKWRAGECLGLTSQRSEIGTHSVVDSLDQSGLDFA